MTLERTEHGGESGRRRRPTGLGHLPDGEYAHDAEDHGQYEQDSVGLGGD